ncbi:hypothetical protein [Lysinibacillus pakistanensis]|uniref:hypothetical protein n=1 Tax=Lysinibacillus pakistanensis TaxID=759811 RepID=UPI003D27A9D6
MNNKKSTPKNQLPKSENQATKLALIGSAIITLGDAISTIAAGLALDEELNENNNSNNDIERLQKQIDELNNEIKQIKKMMR